MRNSPFTIAAILNISAAALHVEESAPAVLLPLHSLLSFDEDFKELKTLANDWAVHIGGLKKLCSYGFSVLQKNTNLLCERQVYFSCEVHCDHNLQWQLLQTPCPPDVQSISTIKPVTNVEQKNID
ncbi:hypothetical protein AAC387_Pa10g0226 [Persea americana]